MKFKRIEYRSANNYDTMQASDEAALQPDQVGDSLTIQSMKDDCDVNKIIESHGLGYAMPENPRVPMYGDFTGISDFRSALDAVRNAEQGFLELPPQVRRRFENNPQLLLEFLEDGNNREEAIALGLVKPPEAPIAPPPATPAAGPPVTPAPKGPVSPSTS